MSDTWYDGICNLCGSSVEETGSDHEFDFMNRCISPECVNHVWHHCYDTVFLEYYTHK
jgi:hypothetical protein